jgi:HEPN domain-containing protein
MDIEKQITYWQQGSLEDLKAANELMKSKLVRQGLFFSHLALEKMIKACITKKSNDVPPKIHDLVRLAEIAGLQIDPMQKVFLSEINRFNLAGRYPESKDELPDEKNAKRLMSETEAVVTWLQQKLHNA